MRVQGALHWREGLWAGGISLPQGVALKNNMTGLPFVLLTSPLNFAPPLSQDAWNNMT